MSHLRIHGLCRLSRDPELKDTKTSVLAAFGVVTNEKYKDNETTDWSECVAFGKTAENIVKYFRKGSLIYIEGKSTLDTWKDDSGKTHSKHKILVLGFEFTGEKAGEQKQEKSKPVAPTVLVADDDVPLDDIPF